MEEFSEEELIIITAKSSEEETSKFLKLKLKFFQDSIDALGLDDEILFMLEREEIDEFLENTQKERDNLKQFLSELKNEDKSTKKEIKMDKIDY